MNPMDKLLESVQWTELDWPVGPTSASGLPWATHVGEIEIMGKLLKCYQLSTGQRIFDADDVAELFSE